ncbi:MAG: flagellar hook protein [Oscillospiraceae bacterium]|nr:flagellar hook protein [Oscillospiraceae bacterium]
MVVQHNISAMNANNAMTRNVSGLGKSTEKLSTGYAINRAADNAAGLAISEKMRSQIRGLSQATSNANDAISLIQTAEGGLQETEDILQRMRELSVQSANGTYTDEDREQIQHEVDALKAEIDRIAESTEFNEMKLLDGSLDGATGATGEYGARYGVFISANTKVDGTNALEKNLSLEGSTLTSSVNGVTVSLVDGASGEGAENAHWDKAGTTLTINLKKGQTYTQSQIDDLIKNATQAKSAVSGGDAQESTPADVSLKLKSGVFTFTDEEDYVTASGVRAQSAETSVADYLIGGTTENDGYADTIQFTSNNYGEDTRKITLATDVAAGKEWVEKTSTTDNEGTGIKDGEFTMHLATGVEYSEEDLEKLMAKAGLDYDVELSDAAAVKPDGDATLYLQKKVAAADATAIEIKNGEGLGADKNLGAGEGLTFQIGANGVEDQRLTVNIGDMSSTALGVGGLDISTQDGANSAINKIDDAIKTVSSQRAKLGAVQNRLEHTVNSLSTAEENLQSAESQIRDTDMASEMIKYTKSNILQQASQSMLAQANQQPQGVLQLLG